MRFRLLALCGVLVSPLLSAQESALIIPHSADDMRRFMDDGNAHCARCGVVTDVRQIAARGAGGDSATEAAVALTGDAGPGEEIETVTRFNIDFQGNASSAAPAIPGKRWRVTVRYDNGAYASFDQDNPPSVRKGDRMEAVAGRVEPR